jgi:hypothetical protein
VRAAGLHPELSHGELGRCGSVATQEARARRSRHTNSCRSPLPRSWFEPVRTRDGLLVGEELGAALRCCAAHSVPSTPFSEAGPVASHAVHRTVNVCGFASGVAVGADGVVTEPVDTRVTSAPAPGAYGSARPGLGPSAPTPQGSDSVGRIRRFISGGTRP